jgi:HEAT repeat protein
VFKRFIASVVSLSLIFNSIQPAFAQSFNVQSLPTPGSMITPTKDYVPLTLKGLVIHPEDALKFDFLMDTGHSALEGDELRQEALNIMKYFLTALTFPEDDMWVNLSPYEKDRIVEDSFGQTRMGRDLLVQDYILKQLTASVIYPENDLGEKFWKDIYQKVSRELGSIDIPVNTFNKVWIVPDQAVVWEHDGKALVVKSRLKVMLDADYLSARKNLDGIEDEDQQMSAADTLARDTVRKLVIPVLEKEVNDGKQFAQLRQMYQAMILATWYKKTLKESILIKVYADQKKTKGVDDSDKKDIETIYGQYLEAFKKGVFNYIKEDYDAQTGETVPRKYFSGGFSLKNGMTSLATSLMVWGGVVLTGAEAADVARAAQNIGSEIIVKANIVEIGQNANPVYIAQANNQVISVASSRDNQAERGQLLKALEESVQRINNKQYADGDIGSIIDEFAREGDARAVKPILELMERGWFFRGMVAALESSQADKETLLKADFEILRQVQDKFLQDSRLLGGGDLERHLFQLKKRALENIKKLGDKRAIPVIMEAMKKGGYVGGMLEALEGLGTDNQTIADAKLIYEQTFQANVEALRIHGNGYFIRPRSLSYFLSLGDRRGIEPLAMLLGRNGAGDLELKKVLETLGATQEDIFQANIKKLNSGAWWTGLYTESKENTVYFLGNFNDARAIDPILKTLRQGDAVSAANAVLMKLGVDLQIISAENGIILWNGHRSAKAQALQFFKDHPNPSASQALKSLLGDEALTEAAIEVLLKLNDRSAIAELSNLLSHPSSEVRKMARWAMQNLGADDETFKTANLMAFQNGYADARREAMQGILFYGDKRGIGPIRSKLDQFYPGDRILAEEALKILGADWWERQSNHWRIGYIAAALGLSIFGGLSLLAYREHLRDTRSQRIGSKIRRQVKNRDKDSLDNIRFYLRDDSDSVRRIAVEALGDLRDQRAIEPLATIISEGRLVTEANNALKRLGADKETILQANQIALRSGSTQSIIEAVKVLGALGDKRVIPLIEGLLHDQQSPELYNAVSDVLHAFADSRGDFIFTAVPEEGHFEDYYNDNYNYGQRWVVDKESSWAKVKRSDASMLTDQKEEIYQANINALQAQDPHLIQEALGVLGQLKDPRAIPAIAEFLNRPLNEDEDYRIYNAAADALYTLGDPGGNYFYKYTAESGHWEGGEERGNTYNYDLPRWVADNPASWNKVRRSSVDLAMLPKFSTSGGSTSNAWLSATTSPASHIQQLVGLALKRGAVSPEEIRDGRLQRFMDFLKTNELNDIVLVGGAVRDAIVGETVEDLDITVKVPMPAEEIKGLKGVFTAASMETYEKAETALDRLAQALGVSKERLRDKNNPVVFEGAPIHYLGPFLAGKPERRIVIKDLIVDANTGVVEVGLTGPEILFMAMDADGKLYDYKRALENWLDGKIVMKGDLKEGHNIWQATLLKVLRLRHQFGLAISEKDYQLMLKVLKERPQQTRITRSQFEKETKSVVTHAVDPVSARREMEEAGFTSDQNPDNGKVGGIALNAEMLDLQIKRDGNGAPLPISQQSLDAIDIQGFIPEIISIQPLNDLPLFLNLRAVELQANST